jgi:hypothetical protein
MGWHTVNTVLTNGLEAAILIVPSGIGQVQLDYESPYTWAGRGKSPQRIGLTALIPPRPVVRAFSRLDFGRIMVADSAAA